MVHIIKKKKHRSLKKSLRILIMKDLKKAMSYIENNLIDSDGNKYLTVDFLIEINNKITG